MVELDRIICGDCLEELPAIPDNSIDAIVTDPPYELTSGNSKKGFMGKDWDGSGIAYNVDMWAGCLRVLKPGGHMLAFGGTRTYHRMVCAIEDAGFEIRDSIHWVYGSGFPKSLDISKALDKMAGAEREDLGPRLSAIGRTKNITGGNYGSCHDQDREMVDRITIPATPSAKQWAGFGTALKPAHEPIVLARKPLDQPTIAANVLRHGVGGINIDGCRVEMNGETWDKNIGSSILGKNITGNSLCLSKDECFREIEKRSSPLGRFPANLIWSHSPLCKRIGTKKVKVNDKAHDRHNNNRDSNCYGKYNPSVTKGFADADGLEGVESWDCDPSCPSWQFAKAGESKSRKGAGPSYGKCEGVNEGWKRPSHSDYNNKPDAGYVDEGTPARFFQSCPFTDDDIPAFLYYAKASKSDRGEGNTHPTVKNLSLMKYLCRLICPPGGLILDPFAGSGTTCLAAKQEGFHFIGIEKETEYAEIARRRIAATPTSLSRWEEDARP